MFREKFKMMMSVSTNRVKRSITFDEKKNTVHHMIVWTYAYREARRGDWSFVVADRCRFQRRIHETQTTLDKILNSNHRHKVYLERFNS